MPASAVAHIAPGLRGLGAAAIDRAQLRVFKLSHDDTVGYAGLVELRVPRGFDDIDLAPLSEAARAIAAINVYAPYRPRGR